MNLQRHQGPSCPDCGCQDSTAGPIKESWWAKPRRRRNRRCNHCNKFFVEPIDDVTESPTNGSSNGQAVEESDEPGAVIFHVVHCPKCGGSHTRVTRKMKDLPVRYHKCQECEHKFKSVEKS